MFIPYYGNTVRKVSFLGELLKDESALVLLELKGWARSWLELSAGLEGEMRELSGMLVLSGSKIDGCSFKSDLSSDWALNVFVRSLYLYHLFSFRTSILLESRSLFLFYFPSALHIYCENFFCHCHLSFIGDPSGLTTLLLICGNINYLLFFGDYYGVLISESSF